MTQMAIGLFSDHLAVDYEILQLTWVRMFKEYLWKLNIEFDFCFS